MVDYRGEIMENALKLLHTFDDDSKGNARRAIHNVVNIFKHNQEEHKKAPRLAEIHNRLTETARCSRELISLLDKTFQLTEVVSIDVWSDDQGFHTEETPNYSTLYIKQLAIGFDSIDDWRGDQGFRFKELLTEKPAQLKILLLELAELMERLHHRWPEDTGGQSELDTMFEGAPKQVLAINCWELFWGFRPGDASGTADGDYHAFIEILYDLATPTGERAEDDKPGLVRYMKAAAKYCNGLLDRKPELDHLRQALPPGHSPVGMVSDTGLAAGLYRTPARLMDELMGQPDKK